MFEEIGNQLTAEFHQKMINNSDANLVVDRLISDTALKLGEYLNALSLQLKESAQTRLTDEQAMVADLFISLAENVGEVTSSDVWDKMNHVANLHDVYPVLADIAEFIMGYHYVYLSEAHAEVLRHKYFIK